MAVRKKYSEVTSNANASFKTKYSLKNAAQLSAIGTSAFVIPLDMANGFVQLPSHTVRALNDTEGFKSSFANKIRCHKFDPNTGEIVNKDALCCKLAAQERTRFKEASDSGKRVITSSSDRNVIPVLVLASCDDGKPTVKKLSVTKPISFAYIDMADMTYREEFNSALAAELKVQGIIDEDTTEEQAQLEICNYLQNSILMVTNEDPGKKKVAYIRSYKAIPVTNRILGETSGENQLITLLVQMLAGKIPPENLNQLYMQFPVLQTINNQVTDFLTLFDTEVDSLLTEWTDEELQAYYDKAIDNEKLYNTYKDVNAQQQAAVQQQTEQVTFTQPMNVQGTPIASAPQPSYAQAQPVYTQQPVHAAAPQPVYTQPAAAAPVIDFTKPLSGQVPTTPAGMTAVATPPKTEADYNYNTSDLDAADSNSVLDSLGLDGTDVDGIADELDGDVFMD